MQAPKIPESEATRLEDLRSFELLDSEPDQVFDDFVAIAAQICGTPIALLTLVDADRQWFLARRGLAIQETPREVSFCGHAILDEAPFVVHDAAADPRFADNPLVTGDPEIRFYAGVPLVTSAGNALGTLCAIDRAPRDLTSEQQDALEALARRVIHEMERRRAVRREFRLIVQAVESSSEAIAITDPMGRSVYHNAAYRNLTGHTPESANAAGGLDALFGTQVDRDAILAHLADGRSWNGETTLRLRPDAPVRARIQVDPIRDGEELLGVVSAIADITQQAKTEEELRDVSETLESIISHLPGAVFRRVVTPDGAIRYPFSAGRLYEQFPFDPADVERDPMFLFDIIHPDDRQSVLANVQQIGLPTEVSEVSFRIRMPSGEVRWLKSLSYGRRAANGELVSDGILLDVTEERRLGDQLRQAQKLEAVGQLTGGIAHDFNNVLAVITANAELIRRHLQSMPDAPTAMIDDVLHAAASGTDLIKGLLGFSRRADLTFKPLHLGAVIERVLPLMRRLFPNSIDVTVDIADDVPPVKADSGAVQQILMNLATNARDAMPDGGHLAIELYGADADPDRQLVRRGGAARYACMAVRDSGVGMSAEILEQVFEPFFTTKPEGEGTGLGMPMIQGLMQEHRGFVHVSSTPGQGTTVTACFPAHATAAVATPEEDSRSDGLRTGHETILLVDDEPSLRRAARRILETLGYRVIDAANGVEGLEAYAQHEEDIELVMTDLVMPKMDGIELCRRIQEKNADMRFLFMSGYTAVDPERRGEIPEGATFASKPWTIPELAEVVRKAIG